ncbi:hypothetical protein, partial [uncultured Negativibacillus sp.]|uniref:hypothetical protein n=1 Tax=uncultured Negativibacillus sp. TaxID=1980696 RepID=UPI0025DEA84E
ALLCRFCKAAFAFGIGKNLLHPAIKLVQIRRRDVRKGCVGIKILYCAPSMFQCGMLEQKVIIFLI